MKEKDLKHMKSKEEIGKMILEKKKEIQESVIEEPQEPLKEEQEEFQPCLLVDQPSQANLYHNVLHLLDRMFGDHGKET